MKLVDYPRVTELAAHDVFLIDGAKGTKTILAEDVTNALLALLTSEDFIGHIDLSALNKIVTLSSENLILVADANGNKAMLADKAAKGMLELMSSTEFTNKIALNNLDENSEITDVDHLLVRDWGTGKNTKITGKNAANSMVKIADQTEFTKKVKPSTLTENTDIAADDILLMEDKTDGVRKITGQNAANKLYSLSVSDLSLLNSISISPSDNYVLVYTSNGPRRITLNNMITSIGMQHKYFYRNKNLGTYTNNMHTKVVNGDFSDIYVGDYFYDSSRGYNLYILDIDYWDYNPMWSNYIHHLIIKNVTYDMIQTTDNAFSSSDNYLNFGFTDQGCIFDTISNYVPNSDTIPSTYLAKMPLFIPKTINGSGEITSTVSTSVSTAMYTSSMVTGIQFPHKIASGSGTITMPYDGPMFALYKFRNLFKSLINISGSDNILLANVVSSSSLLTIRTISGLERQVVNFEYRSPVTYKLSKRGFCTII